MGFRDIFTRFLGGGDKKPSQLERNELTREVGEDSSDAMAHLQNLHESWYQARYPYEPEWFLDLAFYMGLQWHVWSETDAALREPGAPSWRVRMVINMILPHVRTLLGKILRGKPQARVIPLQQSFHSYADARISEKLLKALHGHLSLEDAEHDVLLWTILTGTGLYKVGFDTSIGEEVQLMDGTKIRAGEIFVDPVSPFEILVPPEQKDLTKPGRIIHSTFIDAEILRSQYPETAHGLSPDAVVSGGSTFESRAKSLVSPLTYSQQATSGGGHNMVYVSELYEDPEVMHPEDRERYPNGRVIVGALNQGRHLSTHENPYTSWIPHESKAPFVLERDDRMPGRFWGMSRIAQLIPIQRNLNKGRSQITESRNLCTAPKVLVPKGSGVGKITNQPGQIIEYAKGTEKPEFMKPPPLSQYTVQDLVNVEKDFSEVSQIRDATRGIVPSANIPGIGINLLQEADNTPLAPLAKQHAAALSRMYTKILERAHQFYLEPRTLAIVGPNNEEDVVMFIASRHKTPVKAVVMAESVIPESRSARMQRITEAVQLGILDPMKNKAELVQALELGATDEIWEEVELDRQMQTRELRMMRQGQVCPVNPWDDHAIHIQTINRLRKSPDWMQLPREVQALINVHADEHIKELVGAIQARSQAMAGGESPTGGPPSAE